MLVRATPKSSKDAILGLAVRADETRLIVKVRAAPTDGEANDAIVRLIAKSFGCRASAVSIAAGLKDRDKTVLIAARDIATVWNWIKEVAGDGGAD